MKLNNKDGWLVIEAVEKSGFMPGEDWVRGAYVSEEQDGFHVCSFNGSVSFRVFDYNGRFIVRRDDGVEKECFK